MKRVLLALLLAALMLPAFARAGTSFGVTEDAGKYSADGGAAFFAHLHDLGMTENAVSVQWDPERPTTVVERALLDKVVPTAAHYGVRIVFAVYFTRPNAVATTPGGTLQFVNFLRLLARAYPQVKDFVVGNEPNYGVFWQPQFDIAGRPLAGAAYEDLLARSYDALKSIDPRIDVIGMGLAPRGNDRPFSRSPSTSPVLFLRDVGDAYRRSGRTRPLMDALAYHPYPSSSLNRLTTTQGWPAAGIADLGRIKQAVWDSFHDSPQATFENGLTLKITEIGWQVAVPASAAGAYHGLENVRTTDEATQARIYGQLVRELACDPAVTDVLFFHLVDEADLGGFQSGLIRADGSLRPSYAAVRGEIAATGGSCTGTPRAWKHAEDVVGASLSFAPGAAGFKATAQEGAVYRVAVVRVDGPPTEEERNALERSLEAANANVTTAGQLRAYVQTAPQVEAPAEPGMYVQAVLVSSITALSRTSFFISDPFTIEVAAVSAVEGDTKVAATGRGAPSASPPAASPNGASFALVPQAQAGAAPVVSKPVGFSQKAKPAAKPAPPASAAFRKLPHTSAAKPGSSDLSSSASVSAPAPERVVALAPGAALDSRGPGRLVPVLFGLLLLGAGLAAVVSVRLLGR